MANPIIQKRANPFEKKQTIQQEPVVVEEEIEEEVQTSYIEPEENYYEAKKPIRQQPKQYNTVPQNNRYGYQQEVVRDKYTSTMDQALRRKIKIACATRGIMFAQFVEEACREKLAREGVK